jgi:hypothetical protein
VAGQIGREDRVRVIDRRRARQAELGCEPALERAPQPLDPALRLGAAGTDPADLEIVEARPTWVNVRLPVSCSVRVGARAGSWTKIPWRSE